MHARNEASTSRRAERLPWRLAAIALTPLLLVGVAGCSDLFDVENPGNLLDEDLTNPGLEEALSNAAEQNLSGPYNGAIIEGELLGDQLYHVSSQDFAINIDTGDRQIDNVAVEGMYNGVAAARAIADEMIPRLEEMVSNPSSHPGIARSYYFGGIARMVLASYFEEVTYDAGPPITPRQAIRDAIERFESAAQVAAAAGNANLEAGAYGSIARAYRSLYFEELHHGAGSDPTLFQQAETLARQALATDPEFEVVLRYGDPGPTNPHYNQLIVDFRERPQPSYYQKLDPVSGEPDPRYPMTDQVDVGARGEPMHDQLKWTDFGDAEPLSRAAEAELIIAEARLVAGDLDGPDGAVVWINQVRARSGLPSFASSDANEIQAQLLHERDAELWLEGRSWEDHRYYEIIPERWLDSQKDIGVHVRFPVSVQEKNNNPNYPG